jgi:hypothetical protein
MPEEFWSMTFAEVEIYCKGYETRMAKIKEVPRLVAAILMNVNRKPHSPAIRLEDVFPLYTDKKTLQKLMTKDEYVELLELRKKIVWDRN